MYLYVLSSELVNIRIYDVLPDPEKLPAQINSLWGFVGIYMVD